MTNDVLVITGAGGIGQAIARRQGPGKHVLLADISEEVELIDLDFEDAFEEGEQ